LNFVWDNCGNEKTWEEWFIIFKQNLDENRIVKIPPMIKGKRNPLYAWWAKQKYNFKNNKLQIERINVFKDIGIDLSNLKSSGRNGFTK
jgi:hypothetical protein